MEMFMEVDIIVMEDQDWEMIQMLMFSQNLIFPTLLKSLLDAIILSLLMVKKKIKKLIKKLIKKINKILL